MEAGSQHPSTTGEAPPPAGRPFIVYPILALGMLSFAFSAILIRFASEAPGLTIAVWRTVFAVALLTPAVLVKKEWPLRGFSRKEVGLVIASGILLALHFVLWIESLYHTSVASASVLVNASPVFLAILGYLLLGERITKVDAFGILLGIAGAVLIGIGDAGVASSRDPLLGNSLALISSFVFCGYMIIGRVVRRKASWLGYVYPLYSIVAVVVLLFAFVRQTPLLGFSPTFYGLCLLMALLPQLMGHGSLNFGLRYFPAAWLGILTLTEPVGASVLAYFLFDESPAFIAGVGMMFVLASVTAVVWHQNRMSKRVSEADTHV